MRLFPLIGLICLTSCASFHPFGAGRPKGITGNPKVIRIYIRPRTGSGTPCPHPDQPGRLGPLPDSNRVIIDMITGKLIEWRTYGDKVERVLNQCVLK